MAAPMMWNGRKDIFRFFWTLNKETEQLQIIYDVILCVSCANTWKLTHTVAVITSLL